jgi:hypothetical protein
MQPSENLSLGLGILKYNSIVQNWRKGISTSVWNHYTKLKGKETPLHHCWSLCLLNMEIIKYTL